MTYGYAALDIIVDTLLQDTRRRGENTYHDRRRCELAVSRIR